MDSASDPFAPGFSAELNLSSRPQYAKVLGELCGEWAMMELKMFAVFASLTGAPVRMSRAIFYSLHTTRMRADMLMTLAKAVLGKPPEGDENHPINTLDKLLTAINRSAGKRNSYIHDTWIALASDAESTAQLQLSGEGPGGMKEVKLQDLQQLAKQARVHADALARWVTAIDDKLPALLERHRQLPGIALELIRSGTPRKRR